MTVTFTPRDAQGNIANMPPESPDTINIQGAGPAPGPTWMPAGGPWLTTGIAQNEGSDMVASITLADGIILSAPYTITAGATN
ncbi:hypothetical protein [Enterobacter asburiae]|uniref:hypothetical protein n=1 Tax=Enterobacter asburiae TaxID=61645 RepID=UPI0026663F8B|nr:hypothetical protein [Enterobacter asburiae]MDO2456170.1 hypothetical protein [Enterobacter asburiae]